MKLSNAILWSFLTCQSLYSCDPTGNDQVIGLWESASITKGGIGNNIEFKKDGSFHAALAVLVDLNYEVKDKKLYLSKEKGQPVSYDFGIDISLENGSINMQGINKNRLTPGIDGSIVGTYKYLHPTGVMAYERYSPNGILNLRLPMKSINRGCYKILSNNEIELQMQAGNSKSVHFDIADNKMTMGEKNQTYIYNRVEGVAWYDSENITYQKPGK